MKRNAISKTCGTLALGWLLLSGQAASAPGAAGDTAADELRAAIDRLLDESYAADEPGATVIVVKDGAVLYRGARGLANLELGVELGPDMVFRLGSITKQFTAAAILLLEEAGKLSVTDPITKYLPEYPVHGHTVTIEHLLTHTSGIFNYTAIPGYMAAKVRRDLSTEELVDEFKHQEMNFAPGERWSYSNSGYVLLGAIVEEVSGTSYAEFVQQNIFEPLGMNHSHYGGHQLIPRRVAGYVGAGESFRNAPYLSMTQPHAAGSLLSNVDDLARWDEALYGDEILSRSSRQRMFTPFELNDGEATTYGYGFAVDTLRGTPAISHGGGIFGFRTYAVRLPEERIYVALLSNGAPTSPTYAATRIAALAMGKPFPEWRETRLDEEVLRSYVGVYRIDPETTRSVTFEDGRLYTHRAGGQRLEAVPHSKTGFFYKQSLTHFEMVRDEAGNVTHMLMYQNGAETPEKAIRTDEEVVARDVIQLDPALYDRYTGRYEVEGRVLTVSRDGERLLVQVPNAPLLELLPESETRFFVKQVDAQLTFVLVDGRARELILKQGGQERRGQRVD